MRQYYPTKNHMVKIHLNTLLVTPFCVKRPQMNAYTEYSDKNSKYMNLLVSNKKIFKKYLEQN